MKRIVGISLALAALGISTTTGAAEKQHHIGAGGGVSILKIDDKTTLSVGGLGLLHYAYGLTDAFNLVAEAGYAQVAVGEKK